MRKKSILSRPCGALALPCISGRELLRIEIDDVDQASREASTHLLRGQLHMQDADGGARRGQGGGGGGLAHAAGCGTPGAARWRQERRWRLRIGPAWPAAAGHGRVKGGDGDVTAANGCSLPPLLPSTVDRSRGRASLTEPYYETR
ncbi:UNVERIFIED_CONTAM: hypothetical protein K2H54_071203 [Gekko kuhli]